MTIYNYFLPEKSKSTVEWWLASLIVLLPTIAIAQQGAAGPSIALSRETTFITEPLKTDRLPDYEKYALTLYRGDVNTDNNAAVLLWQAMWPGGLDPADYAAFCRELGLLSVPSGTSRLIPPNGGPLEKQLISWLQANVDSSATIENLGALLSNVCARSWKAEHIPALSDWVDENRSAMDMIVTATQQPRFYSPSPSLLNTKDEALVEIELHGAQFARAAAKSLAIRAMYYSGAGQIDKAWRDALAIHRLARLVGQGPTIIEQVVAAAIDQTACRATLAILSEATISADQARAIQRGLLALPELDEMANALDTFERLMYLDAVLRLRTGRAGDWQKLSRVSDAVLKSGKTFSTSLDWNIALKRGNDYYDQLVAAAKLPRGALREAAIAQINAQTEQLLKDAKGGLKQLLTLNPQQRGEVLAATTIALLAPDIKTPLDIQDAANTKLRLTQLAAALTVYRAEHGEYPEKLEALMPRVLDKLPTDIFATRSFAYKGAGKDFLLYSYGPNLADEQGNNEDSGVHQGHWIQHALDPETQGNRARIPEGSDDISIRLPILPLELPKPTPANVHTPMTNDKP